MSSWLEERTRQAVEYLRSQPYESLGPAAKSLLQADDPIRRAYRRAAEYLAYEVWKYDKPNELAVDSALVHLDKVFRSLEAVGFTVLPPGVQTGAKYSFVSKDWFEVRGHRMCTINREQLFDTDVYDPNTLRGQVVKIDNVEYVVKAVETFCIARGPDHPYRLDFALMVD